ncbi:MAG: fumarate hydratase [Nitrospinota bacterium]|nr:MAG: fumarate hydratase [Nitrospinota bacterium]
MGIRPEVIEQVAYELHRRAAIVLPQDARRSIQHMCARETHKLSKFVFLEIIENFQIAENESRPLCADTGLPRFYVKCGNEAVIEGGFVALERSLRRATASATREIPLRPNRVHPLTRKDPDNNVGAHAPSVDYSFEPDAAWLDITTVHKGGLFGSDYRMLFPADGIPGIKRFFLDAMSEFFRRGLSCQPAVVGVGIGGSKDVCFRLGKEAACLRLVGDRHPDPHIARLEEELLALGNEAGFGPMGFRGDNSIMDVHVEIAYTHTGGLPVSVHHFCFAMRRATARIYADNSVEYREDPQWFTPYYRREGID